MLRLNSLTELVLSIFNHDLTSANGPDSLRIEMHSLIGALCLLARKLKTKPTFPLAPPVM